MSLSHSLKGGWHILRGRMKQVLARLTHDKQRFSEGKEDELAGRLRRCTSMSHQQIRRFMNGL